MNNQKINENFNKKIAECIGLWLAEGDNKCNNEINFSNNCFKLINFFHEVILKLFKEYEFNICIYVYTPNGKKIDIPIKNCKINRYIDKQATKPYFIWRLASVKLNKKWREIAKDLSNNRIYYVDILRGFFAGEGNIKTGSHKNRTIRIAQSKNIELIDRILNFYKIGFKYSLKERNYIITGKQNWDKCAEIRIADLHPFRKLKFWQVYQGFKEEHYKSNHLKNSVFKYLDTPQTNHKLSIIFSRSMARIYDVLEVLKREGKVENFRVRSIDYWIRTDRNIIIISKIKYNYLRLLGDSIKTTKDFAKYFNVDWKSSFRRLKELQKLGLVKRNEDKTWKQLNTEKKVITL